MAEAKNEMLHFKGKPLVRSGNTMYYGDMAEPYVALLQFSEPKDFSDIQLPQRVSIQILSTDNSLRPKDRILKRTDKGNLYDAINIASIWLERMLSE